MRSLAVMVIVLMTAGAGTTLAATRAGARKPTVPAQLQAPPMAPQIAQQPPIDAKILDRQRRERQTQHEKELRADAARLLVLAQQLKASVDKTDKNELSVNVIDAAEKVEKLAKKIRDSMRSGR